MKGRSMIDADDSPRRTQVLTTDFVRGWVTSPFGAFLGSPWTATAQANELIASAAERLGPDYTQDGLLMRHATAVIEPGAVIKGPAILGPNTLVASNTYLR